MCLVLCQELGCSGKQNSYGLCPQRVHNLVWVIGNQIFTLINHYWCLSRKKGTAFLGVLRRRYDVVMCPEKEAFGLRPKRQEGLSRHSVSFWSIFKGLFALLIISPFFPRKVCCRLLALWCPCILVFIASCGPLSHRLSLVMWLVLANEILTNLTQGSLLKPWIIMKKFACSAGALI